MAKILIVEDDEQLAQMVRSALLFDHHLVETLADGNHASASIRVGEQYDLLILDWELPGKSGVTLLSEFRAQGGKAPVLMLTGKNKIDEKEQALDAGADDYLTKPFHMRELTARARALLRRSATVVSDKLTAGQIVMDMHRHRVTVDGRPVPLLPKEFALLEFFMRNPNRVFTAEALLAHVWASESEATPAALRTTMKRLRTKIDPDGQLLRTEYGIGYILDLEPATAHET